MRLSLVLATALLAPTVVPACGDGVGSSDDDHQDVIVFAASSLTAAFTEIGDAFTAANPAMDITFNFGASSDLVAQVVEGAPVDVFASADQTSMTRLIDAGTGGSTPVQFATNALEIVVEPGNPLGITNVSDLADRELIVVTCARDVPCGRYAVEMFASAGVEVTPKSLEANVKAVVSKVVLGEADAGVVYVTDVIAAASDATGVPIPSTVNVIATYPIVVTNEAPHAVGAQAFVDFVLSEQAQQILASYGFGGP